MERYSVYFEYIDRPRFDYTFEGQTAQEIKEQVKWLVENTNYITEIDKQKLLKWSENLQLRKQKVVNE